VAGVCAKAVARLIAERHRSEQRMRSKFDGFNGCDVMRLFPLAKSVPKNSASARESKGAGESRGTSIAILTFLSGEIQR